MILVVGGGRLAARMAQFSDLPVKVARHLDLNVCEARDVAEYLARAKKGGAHIVINCAAITDVNQMEQHRLSGYAVNSIAPGFLAVACEALNMRLLQVSTDYVFGGGATGPYRASDTPFPVQQYGLSKLRGEWASRLSDSSVVVRIGWLFGVEYPTSAPMMAATLDRPAIWDDITGNPTHVKAAAATILRIAWQMYDGTSLPPIIHVASGEDPLSWFDFCVTRFPNIKRGTSAVTNLSARRPRNGGLVASDEGLTISYGQMMDYFQSEVREWQKTNTKTL